MLEERNPAARASVYDDLAVRRAFPMAALVRESIRDAAARPRTPWWSDVSAAIQREFHPARDVRADRTPAAADRLVSDVLHDRALL
jgi:multiple sugar transport system substrate-binding protein